MKAACDNPDIQKLYAEFFDGKPMSHKAQARGGNGRYTTHAFGLGARINPTDKLHIIAGGRYTSWKRDFYWDRNLKDGVAGSSDSLKRNRFIPYAGITYDITPKQSVYAAYTSIFKQTMNRGFDDSSTYDADAFNRQRESQTRLGTPPPAKARGGNGRYTTHAFGLGARINPTDKLHIIAGGRYKEDRFVEGIKKAVRLLKYSKTSYFARISSIIIGICFIGWGIQVESGILIKLIAFTIGGINLWRTI